LEKEEEVVPERPQEGKREIVDPTYRKEGDKGS